MSKKRLKLQENDEKSLKKIVRKAKEALRANILLLLDKGFKNVEIAEIYDIDPNTVGNIKKRYLEGGYKHAIYDKSRFGQPKKYGIEEETVIAALACTNPPEGHKRWTVRLLAEVLRKQKGFETITHQTVHIILKKTQEDHGLEKCGA
jgi:transposase